MRRHSSSDSAVVVDCGAACWAPTTGRVAASSFERGFPPTKCATRARPRSPACFTLLTAGRWWRVSYPIASMASSTARPPRVNISRSTLRRPSTIFASGWPSAKRTRVRAIRSFIKRTYRSMKDLIASTRVLFAEGHPLAKMVDGRLSVDLEMFTRGGLAVLDAIEAMGYDTLHHRPAVSKVKQAGLLGRALVAHLVGGNPRSNELAAARPVVGAQHAAPQSTTTAESYEECHRIARASHSNFYYAFFLLPKPKRDGLAALYALMRLVDDVADTAADIADKQRGLAKWRTALDQAITGQEQLFDGNAAMATPAPTLSGPAEALPPLVDTMH